LAKAHNGFTQVQENLRVDSDEVEREDMAGDKYRWGREQETKRIWRERTTQFRV
jgi:hypothetical protein